MDTETVTLNALPADKGPDGVTVIAFESEGVKYDRPNPKGKSGEVGSVTYAS